MTAPALAIASDSMSLSCMHVPIKRLLEKKGWTAYRLANEFTDRGLSEMAAYRLVKAEGRMKSFDAKILDALADIFEIKDFNVMWERDKKRGR